MITIDLDDPDLLMGVNEGAVKSSSRTVEIELQADDATTDVVAVEASNDWGNSSLPSVRPSKADPNHDRVLEADA